MHNGADIILFVLFFDLLFDVKFRLPVCENKDAFLEKAVKAL